MVTYVIGWLFTGVVVGALARTLMPGRQTMGLGATMLLGIVGALVGGFLSWVLFGPAATTEYDVARAWPGWLLAIGGAVLVLGGYLALTRQSYS